MNLEKIKRLQAQAELVRIGGKGKFSLMKKIVQFSENDSIKFRKLILGLNRYNQYVLFLGTPRRKKKVVHQTAATDDKKLQSSLKKLAVNNIPGIEEVNMIKNDGTVIHFNNPKTQASLASNTFAITGHGETKQVRHFPTCAILKKKKPAATKFNHEENTVLCHTYMMKRKFQVMRKIHSVGKQNYEF